MKTSSANIRSFQKSSTIGATLAAVIRFHEDPRALARLTPLPIVMQLHRDDRRSLTEGEVEFSLWFGPLRLRWLARHEPGPTRHSFADSQVKGPLAYWRHEHIFEEVDGGVELTDRLTLAHQAGPLGVLTRLAFDGLPLRVLVRLPPLADAPRLAAGLRRRRQGCDIISSDKLPFCTTAPSCLRMRISSTTTPPPSRRAAFVSATFNSA